MRADTAAWLAPMLDAAELRLDIDIRAVMQRSTMPVSEACNPLFDLIAAYSPPDVLNAAVDWVRFGELLCEELGWDVVYPERWLATDGVDATDGISGGAA